MFASIGAWFAKKAILGTLGSWLKALGLGIVNFFKHLDAQGWIGFILVSILTVLLIHEHGEARTYKKQSARFERLYRKSQDDFAALDRRAREIKAKADSINAEISRIEKEQNDAANARINSSADALSLRGPGLARCDRVVHPGMASGPSGHEPSSGAGNPAAGMVPADDGTDALAAVHWSWLVGSARTCDLDRAEALSWRSWWEKVAKSWPVK